MACKKVVEVEFAPLGKKRANCALTSLLQHLQDGVCLFEGQQRLIACNERYAEIYNIPKSVMKPGMTLVEVLRERIAVNCMPDMDAEAYIANRQKAVSEAVEKNEVHHMLDGRVLSVRHKPIVGGGWLTTHTDITEIYDLKREIEHMAYHDQLTDLCNRRRIEDCVETAVQGLERGSFLALLFLDLDKFKEINDSLGHAAGDKVLQVTSERLLHCFREEDIVSRLGGDEFAILQTDLDNPNLLSVMAKRIVNSIEKPIRISGKSVSVGASVGVVYGDDPSTNVEDLWMQADNVMYDAKNGGGTRFVIRKYSPEVRIAC
ncbi:MAG: diguanylate cyclase domain-containing protein [Rhizobiaceae bacterium]